MHSFKVKIKKVEGKLDENVKKSGITLNISSKKDISENIILERVDRFLKKKYGVRLAKAKILIESDNQDVDGTIERDMFDIVKDGAEDFQEILLALKNAYFVDKEDEYNRVSAEYLEEREKLMMDVRTNLYNRLTKYFDTLNSDGKDHIKVQAHILNLIYEEFDEDVFDINDIITQMMIKKYPKLVDSLKEIEGTR